MSAHPLIPSHLMVPLDSKSGLALMSESQQDVAPVPPPLLPTRSYSPSRPPTSAEIDAVIAAAMANAPPRPSLPAETGQDDACEWAAVMGVTLD